FIGFISAYMGLEGNPTVAIVWLLLNLLFLLFRFKLFNIGYKSGIKLVTALGERLSVFTEAAAIMGRTVIGALVASVVKIDVATIFKTGEVSLPLQRKVLDKIMPSLLPGCFILAVYKLIASKQVSVIQIIFVIIILSIILSYFGILKA